MREAFRGALLVAALAFVPATVAAEGCPEGTVCETIIIKGEPYKFPTDWLYSPGGYGWDIHSGGAGIGPSDMGNTIANLPTPYEMLLIKESARKAACKNAMGIALAATGAGYAGKAFKDLADMKNWFKLLSDNVKKLGKAAVKRVGIVGGVYLAMEIWFIYDECPDFWGGSTYSYTDSIG